MAEIKAFRPVSHSVGTGQVLHCPYPHDKARLIVREMTDLLSIDLVERRLMTDQMVLTLGYDVDNLNDPVRRAAYTGPIVTDHYGRAMPKHTHGSISLGRMTSSTRLLTEATLSIFDRIADPNLLVRRVNVVAGRVLTEDAAALEKPAFEQLDLFTDYAEKDAREQAVEAGLRRERRCQEAILNIRRRYGKNAILMGMNFQEGGTTIDRNQQIGGHKA